MGWERAASVSRSRWSSAAHCARTRASASACCSAEVSISTRWVRHRGEWHERSYVRSIMIPRTCGAWCCAASPVASHGWPTRPMTSMN